MGRFIVMTRTLISVDLDWLNDKPHPVKTIQRLLQHIPENTPAIITVEHHQFLPQLRRWIKSGKVKTPFNILNIDEHHDYYGNLHLYPKHPSPMPKINCGTWGYHLPTCWYNRLTWVQNKYAVAHNWANVQKWLKGKNIQSSTRVRHRISRLHSKIAAATFCVSPDFVNVETLPHIPEIIEIVADHFDIKKVPVSINHGTTTPRVVSGWGIRPRKEVK